MGKRIVATRCLYYEDDARLKNKVIVPCTCADAEGHIKIKNIKLSEAEKRTIESIAMRLFIEHKRVIRKQKRDDGTVELAVYLAVGKSMEG